jgi:HEAT repeat protein
MADLSPSQATLAPAHPLLDDVPAQGFKAVGDAMMDLNIARKNMLIYPAHHEQARRSLQRACATLREAAGCFAPLTITVLPDRLMVGAHTLDPKSALFKELSQTLKLRGIAAITFQPDLADEEVVGLLKLMNLDAERIQAEGGVQEAAADLSLEKIVILPVDYSKLHVTDEEEIRRPAEQTSEQSTWHLFVSHLLAGTLADGDIPGERAQAPFDPAAMADLINTNQVDVWQAMAYYKELIAECLRAPATGAAALSSQANLTNFHQLVQELNPALRRQFLSSAFDQCERPEASGGFEAVMGGMQTDLVVEMLRDANARGKQISPSLMVFVRKMGILDQQPEHSAWGKDLGDLQDGMRSLLKRESYESYVDGAYDRILKKFAEQPAHQALTTPMEDLRQSIEASLEEPQITILVAGALNGLMEASADTEEYRDWARQLTFLLDELVALGAFGSLLKIHDAVQPCAKGADDEQRRKINALVQDHFLSPDFVAKAVAAFYRPTHAIQTDEALALLKRMGEAAVVEALDLLGAETSFDAKGGLMRILVHAAPQAVQEALERLKDPRPRYVCRMLAIIRLFGCEEDADSVRNLLEHADTEVRHEALATLLNFSNHWGVAYLRQILAGEWSEQAARAMRLAGMYKVREVVPLLAEIAQRIGGPREADLERREVALRTLGAIGDPRAVATLTHLAGRRWSLAPRLLGRIKRVLYESLEGYPYDAVRELLHQGLRQKDPEITATCERLMKQYHRTAPLRQAGAS